MTLGTIKHIVRDRGFGFIQPDGETKDLFFHTSSVEQLTFDELSEGQQVEFETEADPRVPLRGRATHVRLAG